MNILKLTHKLRAGLTAIIKDKKEIIDEARALYIKNKTLLPIIENTKD